MKDNYPKFVKENERAEWDSYDEERKGFLLDSYNYYLNEYKDSELHPKSLLKLRYMLDSGM